MYKDGYGMLISVLVFTVVGTVIALSTMTLGIMSTQNNEATIYGAQVRTVAHGCAELALQEIRDNNSFAGTDVEVIGNGSCEYTVSNLGGENRSIEVESIVNDYVFREEIEIDQLSPTINITLWQEVN